MPTRTQAHEGGTNVTIHIGKQFLILLLEYAFYNALLQLLSTSSFWVWVAPSTTLTL